MQTLKGYLLFGSINYSLTHGTVNHGALNLDSNMFRLYSDTNEIQVSQKASLTTCTDH